jgi:hypothetical protein
MTDNSGQLKEAIEMLKEAKYKGSDKYTTDYDKRMNEAIDTLVKEVCDHHWLPIGEWDGIMMLQCAKCNLYREGEGKKTCVHPYAFVYGGCGKPERCLLCGEILSD